MRKSKIVEEPTILPKRTLRWKCQTCQTWVKEEITIRCTKCRETYGALATSSTIGAVKRADAPTPKKTTKTTPAPKIFSDLGDMFGH